MTKRAELILTFSCAFLFFICFFVHPLFPVQRYPLFADAPTRYESYFITTPEGDELSPAILSLQNTYDGDPTFQVGRHPRTVFKWGDVLTYEQLKDHFSILKTEVLSDMPSLCIHRKVWSSLPNKTFGLASEEFFAWNKVELTTDKNSLNFICNRRVSP